MILRKPYAFLIKYFKLINGCLSLLLLLLLFRLNKLHYVIKSIYMNNISNYSSLSKDYIGLETILLIICCLILISFIVLLFRKKNKPLKDYLYCIIYIFIVITYLLSISSMFIKIQDTIIEQSKLNLYNDISFLIFFPIIYFIIKFILIAIGFDLKKFDFKKDIDLLKSTSTDDEEVEILLNKNSYKYKRKIRKCFREFKYYYLENNLIINFFLILFILVLLIYFIGLNLFFNKTYKINNAFQAGNFTYKVKNIYETNKDFNNKIIKKGYKFIIVNLDVTNNYYEPKSLNFNNIRLIYGKKQVYLNNYYNEFFPDLGRTYEGKTIKNGVTSNYIFIFKVSEEYLSKKYKIKIYDKVDYNDKNQKAIYKTVNVNSKLITKSINDSKIDFNRIELLDKKYYGESYLNIKAYEIKGSYTYNYKDCVLEVCNDKVGIIGLNDANKTILMLEYDLKIDNNNNLFKNYNEDNSFFETFLKIKYALNSKYYYTSVDVVNKKIDNKIFMSVPREIENAEKIEMILCLRSRNLIYKLK